MDLLLLLFTVLKRSIKVAVGELRSICCLFSHMFFPV